MEKLKIGIALGSGSARGWAHIGILNALKELKIPIDIIAGCSIGSVVGAAQACGQLTEFEHWVRQLKVSEMSRLIDLNLTGGGVINGAKLMRFFEDFQLNKTIEQLKVPFGCVATDINSGREVWLKSGPLLPAIRASISLPGFFKPVLYEKHWLVDGGLVNPVPISLCRALGADVVIAVNLNNDLMAEHKRKMPETMSGKVSNHLEKVLRKLTKAAKGEPGYFDVLSKSVKIMQDRITRSRAAGDPAEIFLEPRLGFLSMYDFDKAELAIEEGYDCVMHAKDKLLHWLNSL
jgi:NTE family protein